MTALAEQSEKVARVVPNAPWPTRKLGDITEPGVPALYGILQPGPDTPGGVPYVRPTEISEGLIQLDEIRRTTPEIAAKYKRSLLRTDDIILSIVGTIGKVALVPPELDGGNITQAFGRTQRRKADYQMGKSGRSVLGCCASNPCRVAQGPSCNEDDFSVPGADTATRAQIE